MLRQIIRKIFERVGLLLTHAEVTFLCEHVLNARNEEEFWDKFNEATKGMSKDEMKQYLRRSIRKRKLQSESAEMPLAYA
jgi:hypothetical protein